jgi:hypothetical protein
LEETALLGTHLRCLTPGQNVDETFLRFLLAAARPEYAAIAVSMPCPQLGMKFRDDLELEEAKRRGLPVIPLETSAEVQHQLDAVDDQAYIDIIRNMLSKVRTP